MNLGIQFDQTGKATIINFIANYVPVYQLMQGKDKADSKNRVLKLGISPDKLSIYRLPGLRSLKVRSVFGGQ